MVTFMENKKYWDCTLHGHDCYYNLPFSHRSSTRHVGDPVITHDGYVLEIHRKWLPVSITVNKP